VHTDNISHLSLVMTVDLIKKEIITTVSKLAFK
jgi:hypothetical protein